MGWWETDYGMIGDGPLDHAEECLRVICEEYEQEVGRKPYLREVVEIFENVLKSAGTLYLEDGSTLEVTGLKAKTKKAPKKRKLHPGDVFVVPLDDGTIAYGRLTPQAGYAIFYPYRVHRPIPLSELKESQYIRPDFHIETRPIERGQWKIIGNIQTDLDTFEPLFCRIGDKVCCNLVPGPDGFFHISGTLREGSPEEIEKLPGLTLKLEEHLPEWLKEHLPVRDEP